MRLITIFVIFIAQTHGSWIGDFENVMSSLQSGFQKLMTDVVTDVKDTIDCTVVAVESVLSLGVNDAWYRKCKGVASQKPSEYKKDEGKQSLSFIGKKQVTENLHHEVSKRLENPLSEIDDKFHRKNEKLNSINAYVKSELENLSSSFDDELKKIDKEEKSTIDSVVQYINKIHSAEHTGDNSSKDIRKILNGPSKTVIEKTNSKNTNNDKINKILISLEHQSNNKNESRIQSTLSMLEGHISKDERSETYPKGFKDLFEKNVQNGNQSEEFRNIGQNIANLSTHSLGEDVESMDKIFGVSLANTESHKGMLEEAKNLLQESERSSSILNNLFEKVDKSGRNIFDAL